MRIGEIARRTGTTPKAIRLYEARGLLGAVARAGSYRQYGETDVARVQLIRQALALGFRLADLDGLDALHTAEGWARMAPRHRGPRARAPAGARRPACRPGGRTARLWRTGRAAPAARLPGGGGRRVM